jgi:hypothetical protein
MNIEMITKRLEIIEQINEELKKIKNTIQDELDNDDDFQSLQVMANEHKVKSKQVREKVSQKSSIKELESQLKEKKLELKEIKEVLSQELADYYRQEGTMEIEDHTGSIKRMKFNVSLIS